MIEVVEVEEIDKGIVNSVHCQECDSSYDIDEVTIEELCIIEGKIEAKFVCIDCSSDLDLYIIQNSIVS